MLMNNSGLLTKGRDMKGIEVMQSKNKPKIGIITIVDLTNYGNRLQNYAVKEVMRKKGYDAQTLNIVRIANFDYVKGVVRQWIKELPFIEMVVQKMMARKSLEKRRYVIFLEFSRKNIFTKSIVARNDEDIKKKCRKYDFFVIGSDQIWNPLFKHAKSTDFAEFAAPQQKVCFSPSFGIAEIPKEYKANIAEWLRKIPYISVREKAGAEIVKRLTGKTAEVLIDPTMMLDADDWRKVAKKPLVDVEKKYILCYFLGKRTEEQKNRIEELKEKYGLEEYLLLDKNNPDLYVAGPGEFISLIEHADLVCTDSFHACVFSILFKRPFLVFQRNGNGSGMGSRLDNLLEKFQLETRNVDNNSNCEVFECDFEKCNEILKEERKRVDDFLEKSFKQGNNICS